MAYVPDTTPWDRRGALFIAAKNADETEYAAIINGLVHTDLGVADDIMADAHHADDPDHKQHWEDEEKALDEISGPLIAELDRRAELLGEAYPFRREANALRYIGSRTLMYEYCLFVSLQKDLSKKPFNRLPILFERVCASTAQYYLGSGALAVRTGWPPHNIDERPKRLRKLLEAISSKTHGEFVWSPKLPYGTADNPGNPKDEGMDFVAWKPFYDQRMGQLFLIGQCACGDNWETKIKELEHERLERWLNPVTYVQFVKVFAMPHHIPGHYLVADLSKRAGLVFDRTRLSLLADGEADEFNKQFRDSILETLAVKPEYSMQLAA